MQASLGIDGAFVKATGRRPGQRQQFEILTGRIEMRRGNGRAFAVVRDLDKQSKQKVQAILRRCGRGPSTEVTVLSDGEDGLRGVVGWFGKCRHRLDWFHVSRRLEKIGKSFLICPREHLNSEINYGFIGGTRPAYGTGSGIMVLNRRNSE